MIRTSLRRPSLAQFGSYERGAIQRMEQAALLVTDRASRRALSSLRSDMAGAGLGRLGGALTAGSDLRKTGQVLRRGASGFTASGWLAIRTRNDRTVGAIESYTAGADIRPVKGRYLWIATDEIPSRVNRFRMTPERYVAAGLDKRIGPLVVVRSINGNPLLVVRNASVNQVGLRGKARKLRKNGLPYKGQRAKEFIVAFIGIPRTSRAARVDLPAILRNERVRMMADFAEVIR